MAERRLLRELTVAGFRSLRDVTLPLQPLNVLVGPNAAGKSNVLEVFRFLADVIRTDLEPALDLRGGLDEVVYRGTPKTGSSMRITLKANWTSHSSWNAPDEYSLHVRRRGKNLERNEEFRFKRTQGRGRRITISGKSIDVVDTRGQSSDPTKHVGISPLSSGLSTLPRLADAQGGREVRTLAEHLASFRVFDVDVPAARLASRFSANTTERLDEHAANLSAFLLMLHSRDSDTWQRLVDDACEVLPQLEDIEFEYPSGAAREVVIVLRERGLRGRTQLADASYGTIRLLGLLALLYDPKPPALTCVEEVDHGLHPQALELIVDRLREASARTQFLIATHSPSFANRLRPDELVVCERGDDGDSRIPAISTEKVRQIAEAAEDLPLGELWFSGALGGDL